MNQMTSTTSPDKVSHGFGGSLLESALFAGVFFVLLPVAMLAAMSGWRWQPWPPGAHGYRSFIHEAKIAASTATATAFSV